MAHKTSDELRAANRRSNQRFGSIVSAIGALLAVAGLALTYAAGAAASGGGSASGDLAETSTTTVGVLAFFSLCALITGEQMRRGSIRANPTPPDTATPSATMVSSFRVLGTPWRVVWIVIAFTIAASLLGPVIAGFLTGAWPHSLSAHEAVEVLWAIYGSLAFATGLTLLSSLIKVRATARRASSGKHSQAGWRFWLYRWRADMWLVSAGGFFAAVCAVFAVSESTVLERSSVQGPLIVVAIVASAIAVAGIALGTQFWRTGESLGSGESYD